MAESPRGSLLTERRLRLYPRVAFFALCIGFAIAVLGGEGTRTLTGRLGGDFPAFYGAARIVRAGDFGHLYDPKRQGEAEAGLFPNSLEGEYLAFPYPPYVALLYAPYAWLSYRAAYLVHTALLLLALCFAHRCLRELLPRAGRYWFESFCLTTLFLPMTIALFGGQAIPFLLLSLAWGSLLLARKRPVAAGLVLLGLLLKPHLAAPLLAGFIWFGPWRLRATLVAGVAATYAMVAVVMGLDWPLTYLQAVQGFHLQDQSVNTERMIGFLGAAEALLGVGRPLALGIGGVLSACCLGLLVWIWRCSPRIDPMLRLGASLPLVHLLLPHSMYYDAGLLVLPMTVLADRAGRRTLPLRAAIFAAGFLARPPGLLGVNSIFFVVLAMAWAMLHEVRLALSLSDNSTRVSRVGSP